jgi:hypothetical protein
MQVSAALALVLLTFLHGRASAEIIIRVERPDKQPATRAIVIIQTAKEGERIDKGQSDEKGEFRCTKLPGEYKVVFVSVDPEETDLVCRFVQVDLTKHKTGESIVITLRSNGR